MVLQIDIAIGIESRCFFDPDTDTDTDTDPDTAVRVAGLALSH